MSINVINRIYLGQIGRVPVIEQHEKLSYLNEHISYEVIMLNYTFMRLEQVRDFPILSGFPNHANSASPLLIVRWGEDHGTSLQPGFA